MAREISFELLKQVVSTQFKRHAHQRVRCPRLSTLATFIERVFPDFKATVEESWSCTDTKIPGTRLRRPGCGRDGHKLVVTRRADGAFIYSHDSSETYRRNPEVADWVLGEQKVREGLADRLPSGGIRPRPSEPASQNDATGGKQ